MVPADSRRIPRVPRYSGYRYAAFRFTYWTITVYGHIFQSVLFTICIQCRGPTTPLAPCDVNGLGCSPFARHYWGNHCLFSFPAGTKMFQFPAFASVFPRMTESLPPGCPIRTSAGRRVFAPRRGFSQLVASFFASESQGILHAPFLVVLCFCQA